jgi:hypothetical protein
MAEIEVIAAEASRLALEAQLALQLLRQSPGSAVPALHQFLRAASDDREAVALPAIMARSDNVGEEGCRAR